MENEFRYADFEYRQTDGGLGVVTGTVIRYGDVATLPWGTEEFKAGAFGDVESGDYIANRMHRRDQPLARSGAGLTLINSTEELRGEVTLPDTSIGRDTAVEVAQRILRGLSLEFRTLKDTLDYKKDHRLIEKAELFGFGVVDRPAYPGSVASMRSWGEYRMAVGLEEQQTETRALLIDLKVRPVS